METVNLKTAITFRVVLHDKPCAFTTKTFRGKRSGRHVVTIPSPTDRVSYQVQEIAIDSTLPWLTVDVGIDVLWSNVLSVQREKEEG